MITNIKNYLWLRKSNRNLEMYNIIPPERIFPRIHDLLKKFKKPNSEIKILDASGGSRAKTTIYLAENGYDIFYSEVSKEFVDHTRYTLEKINPNLINGKNRCVVSFFKDLPKVYGSEKFDGVVSIMTIHRGSWDEIKSNWKGISSIIKIGGYLQMIFHRYDPKGKIFTSGTMKDDEGNYIKIPSLDPNHPHNKYSFKFEKGINHNFRNEVFHTYTKEEVIKLCKKNNLHVLFLKKFKMYATESPYWYMLAKKK